jgi:hypothetical protein
MGRATRFNGNVQEPVSQKSIFTNNLAEAIAKSSNRSELSSPNYPGFLQGSDSDSSDDDVVDYPYQPDEEDSTSASVTTRTNPSAEEDPGPSVRFRTSRTVSITFILFLLYKAHVFANRLVTKLPFPA